MIWAVEEPINNDGLKDSLCADLWFFVPLRLCGENPSITETVYPLLSLPLATCAQAQVPGERIGA